METESMKRWIMHLVMWGWLLTPTFGQTLPYRTFTTDDNLVNREVTGAIQRRDGFIWITGRVDDVLNVSGHRIGTVSRELSLLFL